MAVKEKYFLALSVLAVCPVLAFLFFLRPGPDHRDLSSPPKGLPTESGASFRSASESANDGSPSRESEQVASNQHESEQNPLAIDWNEIERQSPAFDEVWEDEHYVPSPDQVGEYLSLSELELERLAETGDVYAMQALGSKLALDEKKVSSGVEWLIDAASHGSMYAAHELANIYLQPVGESSSPDVHGYLAWKRVAYRMGDWQALLGLPHSYLKPMSSADMLMVDVMAAAFFAEINDRHIDREGVPIEIELRPGYEQALNQIMSGD